MIFAKLRAKNQLSFVKIIDFRPLVQQKSSVESSINNEVHQKSTFNVGILLAELLHHIN